MNNLFALDLVGQEAQAQQRMAIRSNAIRAVVDVERYSAEVEQRLATRQQAVAARQNQRTIAPHSRDTSLTFVPLSWPNLTAVKRHLAEPEQTISKRRIHEHLPRFLCPPSGKSQRCCCSYCSRFSYGKLAQHEGIDIPAADFVHLFHSFQ